jgi:hypothetical protein
MGILARPRLRAGKDAQRQVLQRGEPQRQVAQRGEPPHATGSATHWLPHKKVLRIFLFASPLVGQQIAAKGDRIRVSAKPGLL